MIVVVGRVKTDAQKRDELIGVGGAVAQASRAEAGCLSYRLYEDSEIPNEFVFLEEWESSQALEDDFRTAHVASFLQAIGACVTAAPEVKFHEIASSRDLADVTGG